MSDWILVLFAAYIMGSLSPAYIIGKTVLNKDIGYEGSGNLGARNSFKVGGLSFGVAVFLMDVAKGAGTLLWIQSMDPHPVLMYLGALGVVLGHNYSIYLKFRGGKGLASMIGVLGVLDYRILLVMMGVALLFLLLSKNSSVAALMMAILYSFIFLGMTGDWRSLPFMLGLSGGVIAKHRSEEYVTLKNFLRFKQI